MSREMRITHQHPSFLNNAGRYSNKVKNMEQQLHLEASAQYNVTWLIYMKRQLAQGFKERSIRNWS